MFSITEIEHINNACPESISSEKEQTSISINNLNHPTLKEEDRNVNTS